MAPDPESNHLTLVPKKSFKNGCSGNSLAVQCLELCFHCCGTGLNLWLGWGTKVPQAAQQGQNPPKNEWLAASHIQKSEKNQNQIIRT